MVEYPENELIKCCGQYPVYRTNRSTGTSWLECECCRRRTYHDFMDKLDANVEWNELMLRQRDPLKTMQGKLAVLCMVDLQGKQHEEIARILGMEYDATKKMISRIREEVKEEYGTNQDGRTGETTEGEDIQSDEPA